MAAPTTLVGLANQKRTDAKQALTAAQDRLAIDQATIGAKRSELTAATAALAAIEDEIGGIRKKLAAVPTPADGPALLAALEQFVIRARTKRADILKIEEAISLAQADVSRKQADTAAASAVLGAAEAYIAPAQAANKKHTDWSAALAAAPLATLDTEAANAKTKSPFTDAEARLNAIPARLLQRARDRRKERSDWLAQREADALAVEDAIAKETESEVGRKRLGFVRAETAAGNFVQTAKDRFDHAIALLKQVANSPLLTVDQSNLINEADPLKAKREAAADSEKTRDDARIAVAEKEKAFNAEALKAKPLPAAKAALERARDDFDKADQAWQKAAQDRDQALAGVKTKEEKVAKAIQAALVAKKNPDDVQAVKDARGELTAARTALQVAEEDCKKSDHGILHAWEAVMPDSAWRAFDDFETAKKMLEDLAAVHPADLTKNLGDAEKEYVSEQLKADANQVFLQRLAAEQTQRLKLQQDARDAAGTQLFSALRGDY